jgi:hypothetical protein
LAAVLPAFQKVNSSETCLAGLKTGKLVLAGFKCVALINLYPIGGKEMNLPAFKSFG